MSHTAWPAIHTPPIHNRNLLLGQPVQLLDQDVDLLVIHLDLPLQGRLLMWRAGLADII